MVEQAYAKLYVCKLGGESMQLVDVALALETGGVRKRSIVSRLRLGVSYSRTFLDAAVLDNAYDDLRQRQRGAQQCCPKVARSSAQREIKTARQVHWKPH